MATSLNKHRKNKDGRLVPICIARETDVIEVYGKHRGRKIIVELLSGDQIRFRIKGTQQSFTSHIALLYTIAKVVEMDAQYRDSVEKYQLNRKAGKRVRKPKKPFYPVASKYLKALS